MSQQIVSTWDGVQNTNSWVHDGDVERSAVDIVELASSVAGYSAGAQAAADAASGYANTASAAVASIGGAASAAIDSVNSAGDLQINDLYSAADAETSSINALGSSWINKLTSSGGIVTSAVANEGAAQILAVTSAGGVQVALVSAAGTSAIGDLAAVTAAQSAALVSAGGYQSGLIATAGSAQVGAVQAEGGTQIAAVQLAASAQVNSATVAAISAGAAASTAQGAASAASGYAVSAGSFAAVTSGYMVSAGGYATSAGGYASAASGYALTASGYMTSAGGYASAASDSADAAAASAASIAGDAEQIDINAKNITTIQSLLNGAISTQQTDATAAYAKTVPSKAQPYAAVQEIGGKTLVWNQLSKIAENASYTQAIGANTYYEIENIGTDTPTNGHYVFYDVVADIDNADAKIGIVINGSFRYDNPAIRQITQQITLRVRIYNFAETSQTITASNVNVRIHDLTLMFGAGNEPATVDAFRAMFPASYYAYDAGTLISAGVTGAVSKDAEDATLATLPIPAAVQALPGYGWSAGTAYNEIDWQRKVYIQRVGSRAYASGDESDSSVITDGATTYYPLATPIETDISSLLSDDNLIEVESGGTISFPSQLGDNYRLPVPSGVEYTINLAPDMPSTDGTYTLQCTVADGVATYSWVGA